MFWDKNLFYSPGYDTPGSQFFYILKFEYLSENQTNIENILTHWSVAQVDSNGEKNWMSKILLDCPFNSLTLSAVFAV